MFPFKGTPPQNTKEEKRGSSPLPRRHSDSTREVNGGGPAKRNNQSNIVAILLESRGETNRTWSLARFDRRRGVLEKRYIRLKSKHVEL